jgi:endonuclease/exonuclease/phosphatase family metal-dependent hydrolase
MAFESASPHDPSPCLRVANFNLHAGIDGWGRPFDVVAECAALDADVLVLEEVWRPDGEKGLAAEVAEALGYFCFEHELAGGRRAGPHPDADRRWMKPLDWRGASHAIYLDSNRPFSRRVTTTPRYLEASPGTWGLAVLSRLPVTDHAVIELGRLRRDRARRAAIVVGLDLGGRQLAVAGTHMTHITYGSPIHFRRLHRLLEKAIAGRPAVLLGDMNLWGPPLVALMPGWRRAVRAKTWPAWRPHSQVDHILLHGPVDTLDGRALPMAGSDHRPVEALLTLRSPELPPAGEHEGSGDTAP